MKNWSFIMIGVFCFSLLGCESKEEPQPDRIVINGLVYGEDFTDQVVYDAQFRVYSLTNLSNDNVTVKNFDLPENTLFWSYWFVVKQGEEDPFAYATRELASEASRYTSDPLTALGLGLISQLPFLQENTETLDFYLTDFENSQLAIEREPFNTYEFGFEENVISVSRTIDDIPEGTVYMVSYNDNLTKGLDAYMRVVAFVGL